MYSKYYESSFFIGITEMLIRDVVERHCKMKIDNKAVDNLEKFIQNFINKNPEHVNCLGSHLTGTYKLSWTVSDRLDWVNDFLGIDDYELRQDILAIPGMDDVGKVAADNFNITCIWLCHKFYLSNLPLRTKEKGMKLSMDILQYKLLSSIHSHYFKFNVREDIAEATYAELSKKYDIKKYSNWKEVIDARSENIIAEGEIHEETIRRMDNNDGVVRMIQDIQFRLRDKIKNIWAVMAEVIEQDKRITSTSAKIELDGAMVNRDIERKSMEYLIFIKSAAAEKNRFIKPDLVQVIQETMNTMPPKPFEQLLVLFSEKVSKTDKDCLRLLDLTIEHLFNVVIADRRTRTNINDIPAIITRLRGLYTASKSNNETLSEMRPIAEKIIKKEIKIINPASVASLRTGLFLYIALRTMTKEYYQ